VSLVLSGKLNLVIVARSSDGGALDLSRIGIQEPMETTGDVSCLMDFQRSGSLVAAETFGWFIAFSDQDP